MSSLSTFTLTTFFHFLSIITSAVVLGLATVNFGVLSIWINSTAGALTLLYHITVLFLNRKRTCDTIVSAVKKPRKYRPFLLGVKMPEYPSPTYSPPPYDAEKLVPNRRPLSDFIVPSTPEYLNLIPSGPFYSIGSLFSSIVLTIITIVGFGMTVEVSIHGAKSLLPAERAKGMTFPWNMNVQKAQCTFLGVQLLLSLVVLVLCAKGRARISSIEEEKREEIEYGFASPVATEAPISQWTRGVV